MITEKMFQTRIMISVLCMIACMVAMLSSAFAWFTASVSSEMNVISSAHYSIKIIEEGAGEIIESDNGEYINYCGLKQEDNHVFTLTASGTALTGYCKVIITKELDSDLGESEYEINTYETAPIAQGEELTVCIQAAEGSKIEFIPVWGNPQNAVITFSLRKPNVFYINHSMTPHIEYLVLEGATLEALAEYYGVSVEDICTYNGISELVVGDVIKIPGIEDDSIDPYQPPRINKATPSNATPSNAMSVTLADDEKVEDSTVYEETVPESSEETPENNSMTESKENAETVESESASESESAAESESASESEPAAESESASESESAAESESTSESEFVAKSESVNVSEAVIEEYESSRDIIQSEPAVISEETILPEMSTEDIEAAADVEPAP